MINLAIFKTFNCKKWPQVRKSFSKLSSNNQVIQMVENMIKLSYRENEVLLNENIHPSIKLLLEHKCLPVAMQLAQFVSTTTL